MIAPILGLALEDGVSTGALMEDTDVPIAVAPLVCKVVPRGVVSSLAPDLTVAATSLLGVAPPPEILTYICPPVAVLTICTETRRDSTPVIFIIDSLISLLLSPVATLTVITTTVPGSVMTGA